LRVEDRRRSWIYRTKLEIGDVDGMLDGDLTPLMQADLRMRRGEKKA
jgi:hypothetical protein